MTGRTNEWAPRRFWTAARVTAEAGGHAVLLDDRPLRTPARAALRLPTPALARAVAAEWEAQERRVRPETMPLTRAVNVAIDRVAPARAHVAAELARYGETDLICYRAAAPEALVAAQASAWDPLLGWAAEALGARLTPVQGVMFAPQPAPALAALHAAVDRFDPFELTALSELVALTGSLVIGLATAHQPNRAPDLWAAAHVDEAWQARQWGEDAEAAATLAARQGDFLQAVRLLELLRDGSAAG